MDTLRPFLTSPGTIMPGKGDCDEEEGQVL